MAQDLNPSLPTSQLPYRDELEKAIRKFYLDAVRTVLGNPRYVLPAIKVYFAQRRAAKIRARRAVAGIQVPPFMIFSVTERCNLSCKGCYSRVLHTGNDGEIPLDRIRSLWREAQELGIATVLLAGGEPLLRPDILDLTAEFPGLLFPVFTNGTLIDSRFIARCRKKGTIVPVISIEGNETDTDARRGEGVFSRAAESIALLRKAGVFCGVSITVTRDNLNAVIDPGFVKHFHRHGARLFFFIEYVPVEESSAGLALGPGQSGFLTAEVASFRSAFDALFIAFPGDEEKFGGCLAAGRGFVHINPRGDLEACPVAPFSDVNLLALSLREGLASAALRKIRLNHHLLQETRGGCALWEKREEVRALLDDKN